jgi:hypothetical protein
MKPKLTLCAVLLPAGALAHPADIGTQELVEAVRAEPSQFETLLGG